MREEMKNLLEMPIEELMQMSVEELEKYSEEERAQAWRRVAAERLREASAGVLHLFSRCGAEARQSANCTMISPYSQAGSLSPAWTQIEATGT